MRLVRFSTHRKGDGVNAFRGAVAALAALAALSMSAVASGVPNQDRAVGTIQRLSFAGFPLTVHVNARSGPQGEDASGTFWALQETPDGVTEVRGHVTCLAVDGNRAAVRGLVDVSTDPAIAVGAVFQSQITDNGSPGGGADTNLNIFNFGPGQGCPAFFDFPEVTTIEGNFTVMDN